VRIERIDFTSKLANIEGSRTWWESESLSLRQSRTVNICSVRTYSPLLILNPTLRTSPTLPKRHEAASQSSCPRSSLGRQQRAASASNYKLGERPRAGRPRRARQGHHPPLRVFPVPVRERRGQRAMTTRRSAEPPPVAITRCSVKNCRTSRNLVDSKSPALAAAVPAME
jgi:hypothetical protein